MGRPTDYSEDLALLICDLVSAGQSLNKICALDNIPAQSTVYLWLDKYPFFSERYARAREIRADDIFEQIQDIAFNESRDVSGELQMPNGVAVQRDRLKVDSLKWMLGKMSPKKYGDKVELEHSGEISLASRIASARKRSS